MFRRNQTRTTLSHNHLQLHLQIHRRAPVVELEAGLERVGKRIKQRLQHYTPKLATKAMMSPPYAWSRRRPDWTGTTPTSLVVSWNATHTLQLHR